MKSTTTLVLALIAVSAIFLVLFTFNNLPNFSKDGRAKSNGDNAGNGRGSGTRDPKCSTCNNSCAGNGIDSGWKISLENWQIAVFASAVVLILFGRMLYHTLPCPDEDEDYYKDTFRTNYYKNEVGNNDDFCRNEEEALREW